MTANDFAVVTGGSSGIGLGTAERLVAEGANVVIGDIVYRVTPDRLLGRVRSVIKLIAWGTIPLGALAAGFLASSLGAVNSIFFLAATLAIVALLATLAPGMRHVPGESR